ncbi:Alpha-dioxygenase 1 [Datura stramonium]|uniref:Alpha-dioxygenase 1 n=1 Tax=Datura stramonium TaxID=4076 RepID=A0ABS8VQV6_DATST|nr:Alpha-dioxygenase 1 [Datura stramonium]
MGNTTESLKDVLDRHYSGITEKWMNSSSAFSVWNSSPKPHNPISLYFRVPRRRLEADKFFTSNYNEETYTKKELEWVDTTESLKDVLDRHYPEMTKKWMNSNSAFSVWGSSPELYNPIPLYFRLPQQ